MSAPVAPRQRVSGSSVGVEGPDTSVGVLVGRFSGVFGRGLADVLASEERVRVLAAGLSLVEIHQYLHAEPDVVLIDRGQIASVSSLWSLRVAAPGSQLVVLGGADAEPSLFGFAASAFLGYGVELWRLREALFATPPAVVVGGGGGVVGLGGLTMRERAVASLMPSMSNSEIARALSISRETVRVHAKSIYRKLGVSSRLELAELDDRRSAER